MMKRKQRMKMCLLSTGMSLILVLTAFPVSALAHDDETGVFGVAGEDFAEGQVIVCVKGGTAALKNNKKGRSAIPSYETEELMDVSSQRIQTKQRSAMINDTKSLILVKSDQDTESLIAELEANPNVEYAEPNYYLKPYGFEDDSPNYKYQWSLKNQLNNQSDSPQNTVDINATEAWDKIDIKTDKTPVVAIMDTGVDYNHPDLQGIVWDDGENFPELVAMGGGKYGYNALGGLKGELSNDPMDKDSGHGTHCASIIGSQWNSIGGVGLANNVEIMAIRMIAGTGDGLLTAAIKGYAYIQAAAKTENGPNIVAVNNSWGIINNEGMPLRSISTAATALGEKSGVVSCFAAGNSAINIDLNSAGIVKGPYIINVGAIDSTGKIAGFSNYGKENVDVLAPGTQMLAATSLNTNVLPMNKYSMPPQYLPHIQPVKDSYYYENFESDQNAKISLRLLNESGQKIVDSTTLNPGYASKKGLQLDLSSIPEGKAFTIEMVFDRDTLINAITNSTDSFYIAFMGNIDNAMKGEELLLQYQDAKGQWITITHAQSKPETSNDASLKMVDGNWNSFSYEVSLPDFMQYDNHNQEVVLRLIPKPANMQETQGKMMKRIEGKTPIFRLDDIGFGNKTSDYYYADGTSSSTSIVSGIVALLASKVESDGTRSYSCEEIIARIKGGVNREDADYGLKDQSKSDGFVDASKAFDGDACVPVLNDLTESNGQLTLRGYFFGQTGTLQVGDTKISSENISKWETDSDTYASTITFKNPANIGGKQELSVTSNDKKGRNFFEITADTKGYEDLHAPSFSYESSTTSILNYIGMAATRDKIAYIGIAESNSVRMNIYNIKENKWQTTDLPTNLSPKTEFEGYSIAGGVSEFYFLYPDKEGTTTLGIYDGNNKWSTVATELVGSESLVVYKDKLLAIGGVTDGKVMKSVNIIDPTNGKIIGNLPDMPEGRSNPMVSASGENLVVYGGTDGITQTSHTLVGYGSTNRITQNENQVTMYADTMTFNGKEWIDHNDNFLSEGNKMFDQNQTINATLIALNNGVVAIGPIKGFQTSGMIDNWRFNLAERTWSGDDTVLYSQTKSTMLLSAATNGKIYVLGINPSGITFRSLAVDYTGPTANPSGNKPTPDPDPTPSPDPSPIPDPNPSENPSIGDQDSNEQDPSSNEESPITGDHTSIAWLFIVMLVSGTFVFCALHKRKLKK